LIAVELVLTLWVLTSLPILVKIDQ